MRFEDQEEVNVLGPGDWVFIEPRRQHRVEWTADGADGEVTVWLAVSVKENLRPDEKELLSS